MTDVYGFEPELKLAGSQREEFLAQAKQIIGELRTKETGSTSHISDALNRVNVMSKREPITPEVIERAIQDTKQDGYSGLSVAQVQDMKDVFNQAFVKAVAAQPKMDIAGVASSNSLKEERSSMMGIND